MKEPLKLKVTKSSSGCEAPDVTAPFFCDYVRRYLENGPAGAALGETRQERQQRLLAGGLTIRTTLDPRMQQAAQVALNTRVPPNDPFRAVAAADTVEPGTGAVRAMAVNRAFGDKPGETKVNFAIGGSSRLPGRFDVQGVRPGPCAADGHLPGPDAARAAEVLLEDLPRRRQAVLPGECR